MDKSDPAYAGQADYTPFLLKLYDPIVLGVVAGLGLGSVLALSIDFRDSRLRGLIDLERAIAPFGVPVLGQLPLLSPDSRLGAGNARAQRRRKTERPVETLDPLRTEIRDARVDALGHRSDDDIQLPRIRLEQRERGAAHERLAIDRHELFRRTEPSRATGRQQDRGVRRARHL